MPGAPARANAGAPHSIYRIVPPPTLVEALVRSEPDLLVPDFSLNEAPNVL